MSNKQWIEGRSPWSRMKRIVDIYNAFTEEQGKRKKGEQKKRVKAKKVK